MVYPKVKAEEFEIAEGPTPQLSPTPEPVPSPTKTYQAWASLPLRNLQSISKLFDWSQAFSLEGRSLFKTMKARLSAWGS